MIVFVALKYIVGVGCSLRIQKLTQVLLDHRNTEKVQFDKVDDMLNDDLTLQCVSSSQNPINYFSLDLIILIYPEVSLRIGVLEHDRNCPCDLMMIKLRVKFAEVVLHMSVKIVVIVFRSL